LAALGVSRGNWILPALVPRRRVPRRSHSTYLFSFVSTRSTRFPT